MAYEEIIHCFNDLLNEITSIENDLNTEGIPNPPATTTSCTIRKESGELLVVNRIQSITF